MLDCVLNGFFTAYKVYNYTKINWRRKKDYGLKGRESILQKRKNYDRRFPDSQHINIEKFPKGVLL